MSSTQTVQKICGDRQAGGGEVLLGGVRDDSGEPGKIFFFKPTILGRRAGMRVE